MLTSAELIGIGGDVVYLLITVTFFGLAFLLVKACEKVIGPELREASTSSAGAPSAVRDVRDASPERLAS